MVVLFLARWASLKAAAKAFVDLMDEATDGVLDGVIANGSRIGLVTFSTNATLDKPLTSDAQRAEGGHRRPGHRRLHRPRAGAPTA